MQSLRVLDVFCEAPSFVEYPVWCSCSTMLQMQGSSVFMVSEPCMGILQARVPKCTPNSRDPSSPAKMILISERYLS